MCTCTGHVACVASLSLEQPNALSTPTRPVNPRQSTRCMHGAYANWSRPARLSAPALPDEHEPRGLARPGPSACAERCKRMRRSRPQKTCARLGKREGFVRCTDRRPSGQFRPRDVGPSASGVGEASPSGWPRSGWLAAHLKGRAPSPRRATTRSWIPRAARAVTRRRSWPTGRSSSRLVPTGRPAST